MDGIPIGNGEDRYLLLAVLGGGAAALAWTPTAGVPTLAVGVSLIAFALWKFVSGAPWQPRTAALLGPLIYAVVGPVFWFDAGVLYSSIAGLVGAVVLGLARGEQPAD